MTENPTELHKNQLEIQRSVIDLKSRSMRDNLLLSGIPESRGEVCEDTLRDFLKNKLKILDEIPFDGLTVWENQTSSLIGHEILSPRSTFLKTANCSGSEHHLN